MVWNPFGENMPTMTISSADDERHHRASLQGAVADGHRHLRNLAVGDRTDGRLVELPSGILELGLGLSDGRIDTAAEPRVVIRGRRQIADRNDDVIDALHVVSSDCSLMPLPRQVWPEWPASAEAL